MSALRSFVEKILVDAGMANLPTAAREQYIKELIQFYENRFVTSLLNFLTEEQLVEFDRLTRSGSTEELRTFFPKHLANYSERTAEIFDGFARDFIEVSRQTISQMTPESTAQPTPQPAATLLPGPDLRQFVVELVNSTNSSSFTTIDSLAFHVQRQIAVRLLDDLDPRDETAFPQEEPAEMYTFLWNHVPNPDRVARAVLTGFEAGYTKAMALKLVRQVPPPPLAQ